MEIEEIGLETGQSKGNRTARGAEIRRMAQSLAAERLAGIAGTANSAQQGPVAVGDSVKLSERALRAVSSGAATGGSKSTSQLRHSLLEKLDSEILNPNSAFNQNKSKKAGGGGGAKMTERKTEWQPIAKEGQIHQGREVIGKIKITTEVKPSGGSTGVGPGGPKNGNSQAARSSAESEEKNARESSAVAQLKSSSVSRAELSHSGGGESGSAGSGGGSRRVQEMDVKGRSFGVTQTQSMRPAGELKPGEKSLGTFRRLDDKPMLKYVTTHSRDTKQAAGELKKNALAAGETPDAVKRALQTLKDRT